MSNVIAAQTAIATDFGVGGSGLAPGGSQGSPDLRTILQEHKVALAALDTFAGTAVAIVKRTVTIDFTADNFAGKSNGVKTIDKNVGAVLPANARLICATIETVTDFDDAAHGTYVIVVGTSAGGNQIGTSMNVAAGQTGFPKGFTAGAQGYLLAPHGGDQVQCRLTSSVDLNTVTAGVATINAFYIVLA